MERVAQDLFAGSVGGAVGCLAGHPLDTVKVRMQSTSNPNLSMMSCISSTVKAEGVGGLFKGLLPPLLSIGMYQAVCFASFEPALQALTGAPAEEASLQDLFWAGTASGAATVVVTTPFDLLKIQVSLIILPPLNRHAHSTCSSSSRPKARWGLRG
jgi:solute carrier family 25 carnitine/acylcarnitine transporter 20/29